MIEASSRRSHRGKQLRGGHRGSGAAWHTHPEVSLPSQRHDWEKVRVGISQQPALLKALLPALHLHKKQRSPPQQGSWQPHLTCARCDEGQVHTTLRSSDRRSGHSTCVPTLMDCSQSCVRTASTVTCWWLRPKSAAVASSRPAAATSCTAQGRKHTHTSTVWPPARLSRKVWVGTQQQNRAAYRHCRVPKQSMPSCAHLWWEVGHNRAAVPHPPLGMLIGEDLLQAQPRWAGWGKRTRAIGQREADVAAAGCCASPKHGNTAGQGSKASAQPHGPQSVRHSAAKWCAVSHTCSWAPSGRYSSTATDWAP